MVLPASPWCAASLQLITPRHKALLMPRQHAGSVLTTHAGGVLTSLDSGQSLHCQTCTSWSCLAAIVNAHGVCLACDCALSRRVRRS